MDPPLKYLRSHKRLSLGMPKASPSSSTIIGSLMVLYFYSFTHYVLFLERQFVFIFSLIVLSSLVFAIRDTLRFFIIHSCSSLICVECLAFVILLSVLVLKHLLFRAVSFCSQEVLLLLLHPFSFVSNKLIGVDKWKLSCRKCEK